MKERSVVKGINFHKEKNLAHAYRDEKCASVCLKTLLKLNSKNILCYAIFYMRPPLGPLNGPFLGSLP